MNVATYEFPLSEKVRNYLRLEHLFHQLDASLPADSNFKEIQFFHVFFNITDMIERLDLRADFIRDLDQQEKNLQHWSEHPNVDTNALSTALDSITELSRKIKMTSKFVAKFKEDKFLSTVRQRFVTACGATSFDLPSFYCWIEQPAKYKDKDRHIWLSQLKVVRDTIYLLLSFLREGGRYEHIESETGYFQGSTSERSELVRVRCDISSGIYPVLSGNTYRYGIKFMRLVPEQDGAMSITDKIEFDIARC